MKKFLIIIMILSVTLSVLARTHTESFQTDKQIISLKETRQSGLTLEWAVNSIAISERTVENLNFTNLALEGFIGNNQIGLPELPFTGRLITVPLGANLRTNITNQLVREINLNDLGFTAPLYPAQPSYSKSTDLSQVEFQYNPEIYQIADYMEDYTPFTFNESGFMRGQRIFEIGYSPIKYNPVENVITVYEYIEVEIAFDGADHIETNLLHQRTYSPEFEKLFQANLLNYEPPANRNDLIRYPTKYVIVCFGAFVEAMQPFIDWKTQEGYEIILAPTTDPLVGNTTTSIKAYLQSLWNAATPDNPAPSYLMIVGDVAQVPPYSSGNTSSHVTDLHYVRLQGSSYIPDMYYGRFSANNLAELLPQIDKTLMYQQFTFPDPSYLGKSINIAGHDYNFGNSHANSQVNYLSTHYMNESNGYTTTHVFNYPASSSSANEVLIRQLVSEGLSWATYTAHGLDDQWGDPYFHVSHVHQLQNYGKYPVVIGNTCLSGNFNITQSFGESWLRAENKGGVAYMGGTNSTYWDEDFWFTIGFRSPNQNGTALPYNPNILGQYDMLFHTHGEPIEKWHTTIGAMIFAGNSVVQSSTSSRKNYYWEIYNINGDPSLTPYLGMPFKNYAEYPEIVLMGQTSIAITNSAPFARVALSKDNILYGVTFTDENGNATLQFPSFELPGDAMLVITAQKYEPIIDTIQIVPADMPYLVFDAVTNQATGSNSADFASDAMLLISLNNIGLQPAIQIIFEITTDEQFIEIIEGTKHAEFIPAEDIFYIAEPFVINVKPNVKNQTKADLFLTAKLSTNESFFMPFSLTINAPEIVQTEYFVYNEQNEIISNPQPGETAYVVIIFENTGAAASFDGNIMINSTNPLVSITQESALVPSILPDSFIEYPFEVYIDETTPMGALTSISYFADYISHQIQGQISMPLGRVVESFHTGDFSYMEWQNNSANPWVIDTDNSYHSINSARSGAISHFQTSILSVTYTLETSGTISFALKTSTEADNDQLEFMIGSNVHGTWSGETDWTIVSFEVPVGYHQFRWVYRKNATISSGQDAVWIDYITFPSSGGGNILAPIAGLSVQEIDFGNINIGDMVSKTFHLINFGNQSLSGDITVPEGFYLDKATNFHIPAFSNNEYTISFIATEDGEIESEIVFDTNDNVRPVFTLPIKVQVGSVDDNNPIDIVYPTELLGNYPNPFNPETTIRFSLAYDMHVDVKVFNIRGQLVKNLADKHYEKGLHEVVWNGIDNNGRRVSSGVYFYRFTTVENTQINRMVLMK